MNKLIAVSTLLLALPASAANMSLESASTLAGAAVSAGSLESASALAGKSLDGGRLDASARAAVYGGEASKKPSLTFSPMGASRKSSEPPAPFRAASSSYGNDHAGAFFLAGLAAPVVGAIGGALLGGGVGAVAGVLIGAGVGLVLLMVGLCRALRHVFNG